MEDVQKSSLDRLSPGRVADEANRRFVELGRFLMNLTTGQYHHTVPGVDARQPAPPAADPTGKSARFLSALADQVDRILRRSSRAGRDIVAARYKTAVDAPTGEAERRWLGRMFHDDAQYRMAAVRWVRERRHTEAIPTLEGVLSIEEDSGVRAEILATLREFEAAKGREKGETKCSRSLAV